MRQKTLAVPGQWSGWQASHGIHVLENSKIDKTGKKVREDMQPLNCKWPFPGEGNEVPQEDGPPIPV